MEAGKSRTVKNEETMVTLPLQRAAHLVTCALNSPLPTLLISLILKVLNSERSKTGVIYLSGY